MAATALSQAASGTLESGAGQDVEQTADRVARFLTPSLRRNHAQRCMAGQPAGGSLHRLHAAAALVAVRSSAGLAEQRASVPGQAGLLGSPAADLLRHVARLQYERRAAIERYEQQGNGGHDHL